MFIRLLLFIVILLFIVLRLRFGIFKLFFHFFSDYSSTICKISIFYINLRRGVLDTTLYDKVCQWLAWGRWFSPGTPSSSTNKAEILLKVTLKTITLSLILYINYLKYSYCGHTKLVPSVCCVKIILKYDYFSRVSRYICHLSIPHTGGKRRSLNRYIQIHNNFLMILHSKTNYIYVDQILQ